MEELGPEKHTGTRQLHVQALLRDPRLPHREEKRAQQLRRLGVEGQRHTVEIVPKILPQIRGVGALLNNLYRRVNAKILFRTNREELKKTDLAESATFCDISLVRGKSQWKPLQRVRVKKDANNQNFEELFLPME